MANSSNSTEQLITRAKLGEEAALINLIAQVGPRLRRAVDAELEAVQHNLDATQMWNEIQDDAKLRVGEFQGTTETEFEAWAERLALRHIRYSLGGRAASIETIVNTPKTETLRKPTPATSFDPNATLAPDSQKTAKFDPNATLAPDSRETAKFDPNATLAPGAGDTIAPNAFVIPAHDPNATITDLTAIPLAPQTTKRFGDYEILETIAKGGMGVVYKARQRKLNRIVALKMILAGQFADQDDIDRFYVEAEAAAQLRHPNIVGIFEVGECEGQHYFSMEYIEGQSLGDLVREHPLAPLAAARFVKTISEAMHYAHEKGVLHRDLKPSNVLVDNSHEPLITDFGLAKRTEEQSVRTVAGSVLGTPSYMPPEQALGKLDQISVRSDVYSIGAILYELITGKPPFGSANPWETIKQVINNEPVSPRLLNNSVPADLETICLKCLQKDQARRYNSAQDLADELQRFLAGEPILARPIGVIERSIRWCYRNPWPTVALGVLLFAVMGISAALYNASVARDRATTSRDGLLDAIDKLFTLWGDEELLNTPGFEDKRADLLETAGELYGEMSSQLGDDPEIQQRLGDSYFRVGRMMFHLLPVDADAKQVLEALDKGLAIQHPTGTDLPDDEDRLHALGECQNLRGNVLEFMATRRKCTLKDAQALLGNAVTTYGKAIDAREKLATKFPHEPEYERQRLNSEMNLGMVRQRIGDLFEFQQQDGKAKLSYEAARKDIEKVQQGRRELLEQVDQPPDTHREVVHDFAQGDYNLARVTLRLKDFNATEQHIKSAVEKLTTLLAMYPETLQYKFDQALCLMLAGDAKSEQISGMDAGPSEPTSSTGSDQAATSEKLYAEALGAYESAEAILKNLAENSKSVPKYRSTWAKNFVHIGDLHYLKLQDQRALDAYEAAAQILRKMVIDFPADEELGDLQNQAVKGIADAKQAIQEAADAAPPTPSESPATAPDEAN